jgi:hypothetical protein
MTDDGFATSQVATVTVNVSETPLVKLDFKVRQPCIDARHSSKLELVGDFTDEQNVALPASYLQCQVLYSALSTDFTDWRVDRDHQWRTGVITASTVQGSDGATMQAATAFSIGLPTDQTQSSSSVRLAWMSSQAASY